MNLVIFILIVLLHLALSLCFLIAPSSRLRKRKEYIIPVLFVPVFGPLLALTVEILCRLEEQGTHPVELESLKLEHEVLWTPFAKDDQDQDVIPLEEAILINNVKTRRKAMLNTFRDDPLDLLNVLMVARSNEDVDTTHYATIQLSKVQRQFQLKLQRYAEAIEEDPNNVALLDEYIDLLGTYLESPLPEKSILQHQRKVYARLLDRKLALQPLDRGAWIKKLRNCTAIHEDFGTVKEIITVLRKNWPEDEETWIEAIRACVEWKEPDCIREIGRAMQSQKINWTKRGREQVRAWVQI